MSTKRSGLGKGLSVLLGSAEENMILGGVREIPITDIDPNRAQPRKAFEETSLRNLAESIRQYGVVQPILVKPENGRFRIVAGERRWRAALEAGLSAIPAVVKSLEPQQAVEIALIENIQREDLNPVEEAEAIQSLIDDYQLTQEQLATRLGRSRPYITNALRLLTLPEGIRNMMRLGVLSAGHGRALAGIPDAAVQQRLAARIQHEGLSVRQTEVLAQQAQNAPTKDVAAKPPAKPDPGLADLEERFRNTFGTKAKVTGTLKRGKIELSYYSREDLERIFALLERM